MSELIEWLNSPCLPEDLLPLPWDQNIRYMPIKVVRDKFQIMEERFQAIVEQIDVTVNAINTFDKDTCFMATVKFNIYHSSFAGGKKTICGAASFLRGQYPSGWAFSQIAESLATNRAFSKEWKQFGKGSNEEIESMEKLKSPTGTKKHDAVNSTMGKLK